MKKNWMLSVGLVAILGLVGSAGAGDGEGCKKDATAKSGSCCAKGQQASAADCKDKKDCCAGKEFAGMPKMGYKVGDKSVCCPQEAAKLAEANKAAVKYVVENKDYDKQADAMEALAGALTSYLDKSTNISFAVGDQCMSCPMSAGELAKKEGKKVQYRVAAYNFETKEAAEKAAASAKEAANKVVMKTLKDGKEVACSSSCSNDTAKSCPEAKAAGNAQTASAGQCPSTGAKAEAVEYVVGDQKFTCPLEAKVQFQKARIAAAMAAMEKELASAKG